MELIFGGRRANKTARPVFKSYKSLQTHIALVTRGVACSLSRLGLEELDGSEVAGAISLRPSPALHSKTFLNEVE